MHTKTVMLTLIMVLGACSFTAVLADNIEGTGNELWQYCNDGQPTPSNEKWVICMSEVYALHKGFFAGMDIEYEAAQRKWLHNSHPEPLIPMFCMPENVTRQQAALVVRKYLIAYPETLNEQDIYLVIDAEDAAWPCQKTKH